MIRTIDIDRITGKNVICWLKIIIFIVSTNQPKDQPINKPIHIITKYAHHINVFTIFQTKSIPKTQIRVWGTFVLSCFKSCADSVNDLFSITIAGRR
jgi:hypothetical protein